MASQDSNTPYLPLEIILETGDDNPGKRRRNRARVSCINCYASKRKCDRQRPCSRCIKLCLTGLCVYEIDDPLLQDKEVDETTHLKNRVAELESILRQLKQKPHPPWTAPGGITHDAGLLAARQRSRRRHWADSVRSASVDAFLAAISESGNERNSVKIEQDSLSAVPKLPPLELEYPEDAQPNAYTSPRLVSTPFNFGEDANHESLYCPPLSSFVQAVRGESKSLPSKLQAVPICPIPFSAEASTLSNLFASQGGNVTSDNVCHHPPSISPVSPVHDTVGITRCIHADPIPPLSPTDPDQQLPTVKGTDVCRCLNATALFNPLLQFAISLRTSREALQSFHPATSDCDFFRRILELEDYIFSAPPPMPDNILGPSRFYQNEDNKADSALKSTLPVSPAPVAHQAVHSTQPRVTPFAFPPLSPVLPPPSLSHELDTV